MILNDKKWSLPKLKPVPDTWMCFLQISISIFLRLFFHLSELSGNGKAMECVYELFAFGTNHEFLGNPTCYPIQFGLNLVQRPCFVCVSSECFDETAHSYGLV